ncbi:SGNH/GDSL hydrolase family protein [Cohnella mopanensis]|uniref:SGNH/GDSL hydrolase family protein n=1 Tax=Cohnella mopanensis TaxID=2911966 RepID=UPI001EF81458|nr:GDSL-type esterase/lipase family protein [Cohnella mopanensis]
MQTNTGFVSPLNPYGLDEDGLERKNPLVVALGDSVTAGHFEFTIPIEELMAGFKNNPFDPSNPVKPDLTHIEIVDARESYIEYFRLKLIEKFEKTSLSIINSGIAGDTIFGMRARLKRDVIRYQPDLVLINGSLNWNNAFGNKGKYKDELRSVIKEVKNDTLADIILLTPNMMCDNPLAGGQITILPELVDAIRELATEEDSCLADTYAIWEEYVHKGFPLSAVLANGINHPSVIGHEVYAISLMKLI